MTDRAAFINRERGRRSYRPMLAVTVVGARRRPFGLVDLNLLRRHQNVSAAVVQWM